MAVAGGGQTAQPGLVPPPLAHALAAGPLVGRESALRELDRHLSAVDESGAGAFVFVTGEPGVGKTRVLAEFASQAAGGGHPVLFGRCQTAPAFPYEPFVETLRGLDAVPALHALAPELRRRLSTLLPELADGDSPAAGSNSELERLLVFDAVVAALAALGPAPPVLILDDLHWAEASTLMLLQHLARERRAHGALIVGSNRDPDPDLGEALPAALDQLRRSEPLHRVELTGLDDEGVGELLSWWAGQPAAESLAAELRERTDGNPFFLRSTLEQLRNEELLFSAGGDLPARLPAPGAAPADVVETVTRRVVALGPEPVALLTAGALIGREFALDEALPVAELSAAAGVEAADAAAAAGLVHQLDGARVRLRFDHALVQQALASGLSPSRRAFLHLRVGESIERAPGAASRLAELAQHFGGAISFGAAPRALEYARRAAALAVRQYAFDEGAANLELALRSLSAIPERDWTERYELLMELGLAQYRSSDPQPAKGTFAQAAALASEREDPERIARAALGVGLERYLRRVGEVEPEQIALLEGALEALGPSDSALRVSVMSALALERCFLDPLERRLADTDAGAAMAMRVGDQDALLDALTVRQVVAWWPSHTEDLLARVPEIARLARDRGRLDVVMHLHATAIGYAFELNRSDDLDSQFDAARAVAAELRAPIQRLRVKALDITRLLVEGRLPEARAEIAASVPSFRELLPDVTDATHAVWQFVLAREDGQLVELRDGLSMALDATPDVVPLRAMVAELCARSGDLAAAHRHLDVLARNRFTDVHDDFVWLGTLTMCTAAASLTGDRRRAGWLYDLLAPHEGRNVLVGLAALDRPVGHALGLAARTLGRDAAALGHFERASAAARELGALPWEAHALYELGVTLRAMGRDLDAREPLRRAAHLAERFGGTWLLDQAGTELRAAGARPRRTALEGADSLTGGELRVARLAASGLSNAEIAETLVLTRRTVETHLTHVYRKLGATRADLAGRLNDKPR